MTVEIVERMKTQGRLREVADRLRVLARRRQDDKGNGPWYERQLRNRGAAQAYRHAAQMLEDLRRELDE